MTNPNKSAERIEALHAEGSFAYYVEVQQTNGALPEIYEVVTAEELDAHIVSFSRKVTSGMLPENTSFVIELHKPEPPEDESPIISTFVSPAVREAARRSGKTLNDWIGDAIQKAADASFPPEANQTPHGHSCQLLCHCKIAPPICSCDGCNRTTPCGPYCQDHGNLTIPEPSPVVPPEPKRLSTIHTLKTHPAPFAALKSGKKTFEYRKMDRVFQLNDILHLVEYDETVVNPYTGEYINAKVVYILRGGSYGIPDDYCILTIEQLPREIGQ